MPRSISCETAEKIAFLFCHVVKPTKTSSGTIRVPCQLIIEAWSRVVVGEDTSQQSIALARNMSIENAYFHYYLRLERLRLGSNPRRLRGSPRLLVDGRPRRAHRLQGVKGDPVRHLGLPSKAQGNSASVAWGYNRLVINVMPTYLTSKPPTMMCELRNLLYLINPNDMKIQTRYIRSFANISVKALLGHRNLVRVASHKLPTPIHICRNPLRRPLPVLRQ